MPLEHVSSALHEIEDRLQSVVRVGRDPADALLDGWGDAAYVGLRLAWLAVFVVVSAVLALGAFGKYRRSI